MHIFVKYGYDTLKIVARILVTDRRTDRRTDGLTKRWVGGLLKHYYDQSLRGVTCFIGLTAYLKCAVCNLFMIITSCIVGVSVWSMFRQSQYSGVVDIGGP